MKEEFIGNTSVSSIQGLPARTNSVPRLFPHRTSILASGYFSRNNLINGVFKTKVPKPVYPGIKKDFSLPVSFTSTFGRIFSKAGTTLGKIFLSQTFAIFFIVNKVLWT